MNPNDEQDLNNLPADPQLEGLDPGATQLDPLPEDNDSPAAPADENGTELPIDHPATDSAMDQHEQYDAGPTTASGINAQDESEEDKDQALNSGQ